MSKRFAVGQRITSPRGSYGYMHVVSQNPDGPYLRAVTEEGVIVPFHDDECEMARVRLEHQPVSVGVLKAGAR